LSADLSAHQRLAWSDATDCIAKAAKTLAWRHEDLLVRLGAASLYLILPFADGAQPTIRLLDSRGEEVLRDTVRMFGPKTSGLSPKR
jgi:hypothetical protein